MNGFFFTLILLGAIQGVITCGLLLFSRKSSLPHRLLAAIIGLITLPGFHLYFHYNGWFDSSKAVQAIHDILPLVVIMPTGPLLFFYIRSMLEPGFRLGRKEKLHFIPVLIDLLPKFIAVIFYLSVWSGNPWGSREELARLTDIYSQYADIPRWLSMTVYTIWGMRYLRSKKMQADIGSLKNSVVVRWLQGVIRLFIVFQAIWFLYLVPYIVPASSGWLLDTVNWFPIYIPMAILIYWLGIKGYLVMNGMPGVDKKNTATISGLSSELVSEAHTLLTRSMQEDKLYLHPDLSLDKLAQFTGLTPKIISAVLNQYKETSFTNFVNQYRIEDFKQRLSNREGQQLTIAGLAMECGFNSPATFQRAFKQFTGLSPTAFLKSLENDAVTG